MRIGKATRADAIVAPGMDGAGHDSGVVAAGSQQECEVVGADEVVDLVDRFPGRDVIGLGELGSLPALIRGCAWLGALRCWRSGSCGSCRRRRFRRQCLLLLLLAVQQIHRHRRRRVR